MHANPSLSWVLERVSHLQQGLPFPLPTLGGEGLWGGGTRHTQSCYPQSPSQISIRESTGLVVMVRTK